MSDDFENEEAGMVVMDMPVLAVEEQRLAALALANEVRVGRAELKRELARASMESGLASVAGLVGDPPELIGSMKVLELLAAVRGFSTKKGSRVMLTVGISQAKTVGGMSARQRLGLAEELLLLTDRRRREARARGRVVNRVR